MLFRKRQLICVMQYKNVASSLLSMLAGCSSQDAHAGHLSLRVLITCARRTPTLCAGGGARAARREMVQEKRGQRDWCFFCQTISASTAPRTSRRTCCPYAYVLVTVLRVSRSCEHFPDGFDFHLLRKPRDGALHRSHLCIRDHLHACLSNTQAHSPRTIP